MHSMTWALSASANLLGCGVRLQESIGLKAWVLSSFILAMGAMFRGLENAIRFRRRPLRASLGWASLGLGGWAGLAALDGSIAGVAWLGLCGLGTVESVLAKGLEQGGSDPMTLWMRAFAAAACFVSPLGRDLLTVLGAGVLLASYVCAGLGKLGTKSWWDGRALQAYLARPCYLGCQPLIARIPPLGFRWLGWGVLAFELFAPAVLVSDELLVVWVLVGIIFHLSNIFLFGLHRFFWTWVAAYPMLFALGG